MELSAIKSNCLQCYTVKLFVHFVTVCLKAQKWTQIDSKVTFHLLNHYPATRKPVAAFLTHIHYTHVYTKKSKL